jgi:hypothetical protein
MPAYAQIYSNSLFIDHGTTQYFNDLGIGADTAVTMTLPNTFFDRRGLLHVAANNILNYSTPMAI